MRLFLMASLSRAWTPAFAAGVASEFAKHDDGFGPA